MTLQTISIGLISTVFLSSEPLDKVPAILRAWQPATFSKQYCSDIVELAYVSRVCLRELSLLPICRSLYVCSCCAFPFRSLGACGAFVDSSCGVVGTSLGMTDHHEASRRQDLLGCAA